MNKSTDIKDLRERIDRMQNAIQPLLKENGAKAALWEEWKYSLVHATWREKGNKGTYYRMRVVSLVSAIIVPALVGLNFAGTGGIVVRWLTFAFSLVAAIATGILTLYRTGDRWLMYRRLMDSLMASGCTLVEGFSADSQRQQAAWAAFTSANDRAIATYNKTYEAAVIHVAQSGSSHPGPTDGDKETKTTTKQNAAHYEGSDGSHVAWGCAGLLRSTPGRRPVLVGSHPGMDRGAGTLSRSKI